MELRKAQSHFSIGAVFLSKSCLKTGKRSPFAFLISLMVSGLTLSACSKGFDRSSENLNSNLYSKSIIGGEKVSDTDPISSVTALLIDIKQGSICTASILNSEWLLTAAHCVNDSKPESLIASFKGSYQDIASGQSTKDDLRRVQSFFVHPKYALTMKQFDEMVAAAKASGKVLTSADVENVKDWGDIALVRISGKIPSYKTASELMPPSLSLAKGELVELAGYGQTGSDQSSGFGSLNKVAVKISEPIWGEKEVLMDQQYGKGACHGDSGGPAYKKIADRYYLFGVTSRGMGDGKGPQCTHFSIYTNAVMYQEWITETLSRSVPAPF